MATLTINKQIDYVIGDVGAADMIADDVIYEGAAVGEVAASGHARPLQAGDKFLGIALDNYDNSGGAAAAKKVEYRYRGIAVLSVGSLAITNLGEAVYASDDDTYTLVSTSNSYIGFVHRYVSSGKGEVVFNASLVPAA